MWQAVPGTFLNSRPARIAATAYEQETGVEWVVVRKINSDIGKIYFQPCRVQDIEEANKDGWEIIGK